MSRPPRGLPQLPQVRSSSQEAGKEVQQGSARKQGYLRATTGLQGPGRPPPGAAPRAEGINLTLTCSPSALPPQSLSLVSRAPWGVVARLRAPPGTRSRRDFGRRSGARAESRRGRRASSQDEGRPTWRCAPGGMPQCFPEAQRLLPAGKCSSHHTTLDGGSPLPLPSPSSSPQPPPLFAPLLPLPSPATAPLLPGPARPTDENVRLSLVPSAPAFLRGAAPCPAMMP